MKHVPRTWLRYFQLALLLLDVLVVILYFYQPKPETAMLHADTPLLHSHSTEAIVGWGVNMFVLVLAGLHALYTLSVVWWLDKKRTWIAHAIGALLSGCMLVLLANSASSIHTWYHLLLMCFMFSAAMVGSLVGGVTFSLAFIFLIVTSLGSGHLATDPAGHVTEMILVSLSGLSGSVGWFLFSKHYTQNADIRDVQNLTSLVKQERTTVNLILESITDGVMIISTEGVVQILNISSAKMLGWPKEEAQNLQYASLLQPVVTPDTIPAKPAQPPQPSAIAETLRTAEPKQQVSLVQTRDNRQIYVDITASPILKEAAGEGNPTNKKLVGVIAVLRDVDKQKRGEAQRSEFISTASHEMRTPVAAIEGYLALALNDKVSTVDSKARAYLEKAHSSTQHLGKLFQDLLTSAKAEDGRLVSHPVVVEMGHYMEQLADSLRFAAQKKGLAMDFTVGTSASSDPNAGSKIVKPLYYVRVDPDRLREVITNIFDNAVKYTESGKISIGLTGNTEVIQMFIKDTGAGIPAEDQPHLFQKFYRVDNSATRTIGGTGLGLFISRKIVELYKGRIWVESTLGQGSTFYINLPRLSSEKAEEMQRHEAAQTANTSALDKPTTTSAA